MKDGDIGACRSSENTGATSNTIVVAEAKLDAFPIVGPFMNKLATEEFKQDALSQMPHGSNCPPSLPGPVPAVGFSGGEGGNYQFVVRGSAVARRNYGQ